MKMSLKTGIDLERQHHEKKMKQLDEMIDEESRKIAAGERDGPSIDSLLRKVGLPPELKLIQVVPKIAAEQDASNPAFTVAQQIQQRNSIK